jgi:ADP-heptose:LPS heptosyltransferase
MNKVTFLLVQTAFIGDAILATALLEKLHAQYPGAQIDYLIRKGNESLFQSHPFINKLYVWDKTGGKYKNLFEILKSVRHKQYNYIINLQRFASTGLFVLFSKAKQKIGFKKNPFSFFFNVKVDHSVNNGMHEVARNHKLISLLTNNQYSKPRLYPTEKEFEKVKTYNEGKYICISPASVWFTKQFPKEKWIDFINHVDQNVKVFLLGAHGDFALCDEIVIESSKKNIQNLSGKLSLLESAALMRDALMNYTNDSAPMHLASSMDAPITAIFCSTVPTFGFGPLSSNSVIVETREKLDCRPCGLHGKKACPKTHFKCAYSIDIYELLSTLKP